MASRAPAARLIATRSKHTATSDAEHPYNRTMKLIIALIAGLSVLPALGQTVEATPKETAEAKG